MLLVVMVLRRVLRAVMLGGYRILYPLYPLSISDLLIGAMAQFKLEPMMRSALTGANATTQCTGEK
jgi:hypothetical protein